MNLAITVIIPVYKDWVKLERALECLRMQDLDSETFEVIVVDNAEEPLLQSLRPAGVIYVHEPKGWSYAARNAGVRHAHADLLAFTDADCLPSPNWLSNGLRALHGLPGVDLIGGAVKVVAKQRSLAAVYDQCFGIPQHAYFKQFGCFATANLIVRRRVWESLGGFNAKLESGGDFNFCRRARRAGFTLEYRPDVEVSHPARDTIAELVAKTKRVARGNIEDSFRNQHKTRRAAWFAALKTFRPRFVDWYFVLAGGRGSEAVGGWTRPAVLILRIYLHYVRALAICTALHRSIALHGWPAR